MDAQIKTLRVRGAKKNDVALRLRLSNLLGVADLRPDGAPPASVLFVRRFEDPMPGRITVDGSGAHVDRAWERAVRQQLGHWYRAASRPHRGILPSTSEAVVFADESEMVACLALDLAKGEATQRWWWQSMLRRIPAGSRAERIGSLLRENSRAAPASLHHLTSWNAVAPVLEALTEAEAQRVFDAICQAFSITHLSSVLYQPAGPNGHEIDSSAPRSEWSLDEHRFHMWGNAPIAYSVVPAELGPSRRGLLSIALTLQKSPALVRRPEFSRVLRTWMAEASDNTFRSDGAASAVEAPTARIAHQDRGAAAILPRNNARAEEAAGRNLIRGPGRGQDSTGAIKPEPVQAHPEDGTASGPPPATRHARAEERLGTPSGRSTHSASRDAAAAAAPEDIQEVPDLARYDEGHLSSSTSDARTRSAAESSRQDAAHAGDPDVAPRDAAAPIQTEFDETINTPGKQVDSEERSRIEGDGIIHTRLGGVFYLINLMMHLDMPDCFDASWRLEDEVGTWGMLEVLARALLQVDQEDLTSDPLWRSLAVLDGRPPDLLPDSDARESPDYVIPLQWLAEAHSPDVASCRWAARRGHLRVWSDAGFLMADVSCPRRLSAAKAREMMKEMGFRPDNLSRRAFREAPVDQIVGPLTERLGPFLLRWASFVVPYLRYRLCTALAIDRIELAEQLLLQDARLYITSSHIDLVIPIDSISVAVRRAGLDRNPGWWPLLGRVVYFHFD